MTTLLRRMLREPHRLVDQVLVGHRLAAAHAGVGGDHHLRLRVVDARGEARRGEAAEHDRMDRADARAGEHRERRLGDHRHVDQHAIAAARRPAPCRIAAKRFTSACELAVRVARRSRRSRSRCRSSAAWSPRVARWRSTALWQRLVRPPTNQLRERRPRVVEHRRERRLPVDQRGLARARTPRGRRASDGGSDTSLVARPAATLGSPTPRAIAPASRTSAVQGCVSGAMRTTVRPRTMPLRYGSKCVGSSSKSIVRTWSCTRSGRHSTASLFQIFWRSDIGQFGAVGAEQANAAQDERRDRRVELHAGGEADRRDGAADLRRRQQPREHVAAEVVDGAGPRRTCRAAGSS